MTHKYISSLHLPLFCHCTYFIQGLRQSFCWTKTLETFFVSAAVQKAMGMTLVLNGGLFLGCLWWMERVFHSEEHTFFGYSYKLWTGYFLYLVCLLANSQCYQSISQAAFRLYSKDSSHLPKEGTQQWSSLLSTTIIYTNFSLVVFLLRQLPLLGGPMAYLASCSIMAYYCFEYKWTYLGWSRQQYMVFIEQHWAYFLGFGCPLATMTFFLSTLHAGAVFALVYPSYIVMASFALPQPTILGDGEPLVPHASVPFASLQLPFHMPFTASER